MPLTPFCFTKKDRIKKVQIQLRELIAFPRYYIRKTSYMCAHFQIFKFSNFQINSSTTFAPYAHLPISFYWWSAFGAECWTCCVLGKWKHPDHCRSACWKNRPLQKGGHWCTSASLERRPAPATCANTFLQSRKTDYCRRSNPFGTKQRTRTLQKVAKRFFNIGCSTGEG